MEIDWAAREEEFRRLVAEVKALGRRYDCVIPVSGGKDSTWQVVTALEHGLHPLAVTWRPPGRNEIGRRNLDNLIDVGVDHIDFSVSGRVERKFLLSALERHGTTAIPMHLALFNIPATIAARFEIPLIVWGENSATEYVGTGAHSESARLDSAWVRRYGAVKGTSAADWVSAELTEEELRPFFGPTDEELRAKGVDAVFLGYFFRWDPATTAAVARRHGFRDRPEGAKTGYYDYADIDDDFISIHHYLKWHKFGFTRTYDNLSLEIRNGRMTRDEAIEVLRQRGPERPSADIELFCKYTGISVARFDEICERFRNPDIWTLEDGVWKIADFLIPGWDWAHS